MNMRTASFGFFLIVTAFVCSAQSKPENQANDVLFEHGLWACSDSDLAIELDQEFTVAARKLKLTHEVADQISDHEQYSLRTVAKGDKANDSCRHLNSDELRPVKFIQISSYSPGTVVLYVADDKKNEGWVGLWSYLAYMRSHVVRSAKS